MKAHAYLAGVLVLAAGLLAGCKDSDSNPAQAPPAQTARVMAVHASPDAPPVDLYVDNVKVNTSPLSFPNHTGYFTVAAGTRTLKITPAGDTTAVLMDTGLIPAGVTATLFAANAVDSLTLEGFLDTLATPAAGKSHVRFIHMSPDAPAVDIAVTGGPVVFSNVGYREGTSFLPLDAATYDLEVRVAGTSTVVLTLPGTVLQAGKIYTVWASGFVGGSDPILRAQFILNN